MLRSPAGRRYGKPSGPTCSINWDSNWSLPARTSRYSWGRESNVSRGGDFPVCRFRRLSSRLFRNSGLEPADSKDLPCNCRFSLVSRRAPPYEMAFMRQHLNLPSRLDGSLWHYRNLGRTHAMHHHAELEFNLVTQGAGLYLLANRKYQIRRGDLRWLFPAQEHVLIEQTPDFEMWIGVFKPKAVRRIAVDPGAKVLQQADPAGEYCRRLTRRSLARLDAMCADVAAA